MAAWLSPRSQHGGVDEIPSPPWGWVGPAGVLAPDSTPSRGHPQALAPDSSGGLPHPAVPSTPGRLWLCGKHFVGPDPEAALAEVGADLVVCLTERHELASRYPSYVAWLDANAGTRALWHPIPDLHAPGLGEALPILGELQLHLANGRVLLLHCGAGIGRAGTVAAALLLLAGTSLDDALEVVATSRPMAGPEAGAQSELLASLAGSRRIV